jgi:hypothetical protein
MHMVLHDVELGEGRAGVLTGLRMICRQPSKIGLVRAPRRRSMLVLYDVSSAAFEGRTCPHGALPRFALTALLQASP